MTLIDRLAELEHKHWVQWAQKVVDTEPGLSIDRIERWKRLISVPYCELSEEWKEYDREWARKILREVRLNLEEDHVAYFGGYS